MIEVLMLFTRFGSHLVDKNIVHDRKQPRTQIATGTPETEAFPGSLESILNEILGRGVIARERSRVATQLRDMSGYTLGIVHNLNLTPSAEKRH